MSMFLKCKIKSTFELQEELTNLLRREVSVEMDTMAGMGTVDPCFNGTLSTGMQFLTLCQDVPSCSLIFQDWFCLHPDTASLV